MTVGYLLSPISPLVKQVVLRSDKNEAASVPISGEKKDPKQTGITKPLDVHCMPEMFNEEWGKCTGCLKWYHTEGF